MKFQEKPLVKVKPQFQLKKSKRKKEEIKQINKIGSIREKYHMAGSKSLNEVQERLAVKVYPNYKDCNFGDVCNME